MNSIKEVLNSTEKSWKDFRETTSRIKRSEIGQFQTPTPIACFMASLFQNSSSNIRILDAGAGTGVLFAALITQLCFSSNPPKKIEVVAYENDETIVPYLYRTMKICEDICSEKEIKLISKIYCEDFITEAIGLIQNDLFIELKTNFTHVILNPPYKKINGLTNTRIMLNSLGIETSNLYSAFVWLSFLLLQQNGELVAITPRSFCNGPYFKKFRQNLLRSGNLRRIHLFESRKEAFADDSVLQENIIFHYVKSEKQSEVINISVSKGTDFEHCDIREVPFNQVINPRDKDSFIHLIENDNCKNVINQMSHFTTSLKELGLEVSTGRVVDFRVREYLMKNPDSNTAPLVYPCHFESGFVKWPSLNQKKPNAIVLSSKTKDLLVPTGYYVLTKRFTAKEENKRVVAAIFDPCLIEASLIGFENHLNFFHLHAHGLSRDLACGLALFLNSSLFDKYFRLFSGHTQVNATDLRKMNYPSVDQLLSMGKKIENSIPDQEIIDSMVEEICIKTM